MLKTWRFESSGGILGSAGNSEDNSESAKAINITGKVIMARA